MDEVDESEGNGSAEDAPQKKEVTFSGPILAGKKTPRQPKPCLFSLFFTFCLVLFGFVSFLFCY